MQRLVKLSDTEFKLYYNDKVYSPAHSSMGTILLADKLIKDGKRLDTHVLDVGCGSGVLGLGIKKLNAFAEVMMVDKDPEALRISRLNAKRLGLAVGIYQSDLVPALGLWHIIVANLPTFTAKQMVEEPLYGPEIAYNGGKDGLFLYQELFKQATGRCKALVCEIQPKHQKKFLEMALSFGYIRILDSGDAFAFLAPPML